MNIVTVGLAVFGSIVGLVALIVGYFLIRKINFEQKQFGPAVFIHSYHIGAFYSVGKTLDRVTNQFKDKNGLQMIAEKLKVDCETLKYGQAGIFYDDPKECEESKLRSAIGVLIRLPEGSKFDMRSGHAILRKLSIDGGYMRILPKTKYMMHFFPLLFGFLDVLSYMIAPMRVYGTAAKQNIFKAAPMEMFNNATILGGPSDNYCTFMFAQENANAFKVDADMRRESDEKYGM